MIVSTESAFSHLLTRANNDLPIIIGFSRESLEHNSLFQLQHCSTRLDYSRSVLEKEGYLMAQTKTKKETEIRLHQGSEVQVKGLNAREETF